LKVPPFSLYLLKPNRLATTQQSHCQKKKKMGNQRNLRTRISKEEEEDVTTTKTQTLQDYERIREQRIKENDEKLRKLGLLKLALQPKKTLRPYIKKNPIPSDQPERRSSRYYYFYLQIKNALMYLISNIHYGFY
jgi:hypothetical protein